MTTRTLTEFTANDFAMVRLPSGEKVIYNDYNLRLDIDFSEYTQQEEVDVAYITQLNDGKFVKVPLCFELPDLDTYNLNVEGSSGDFGSNNLLVQLDQHQTPEQILLQEALENVVSNIKDSVIRHWGNFNPLQDWIGQNISPIVRNGLEGMRPSILVKRLHNFEPAAQRTKWILTVDRFIWVCNRLVPQIYVTRP